MQGLCIGEFFASVIPYIIAEDNGVTVTFETVSRQILAQMTFAGNTITSFAELRRAALIRVGATIDESILTQIKNQLTELYRSYGYFDATIEVELVPLGAGYANIEVDIDEGYRSRIEEIIVRGITEHDISPIEADIIDRGEGMFASVANTDYLKSRFLKELRKMGYLKARVIVEEMAYQELSGDVHVRFFVITGELLSLELLGNQSFPDEILFALLPYDKKQTPFTNSSIVKFIEDLKSFYHSKGFVDVDVVTSEVLTEDGIKILRIVITEGKSYVVRNIHMVGAESISRRRLLKQIEHFEQPLWPISHWYPAYASEELSREDAEDIRQYYEDNGFWRANVIPRIEKINDSEIDIFFQITEGSRTFVQNVEVLWDGAVKKMQSSPSFSKLVASSRVGVVRGQPFEAAAIENARALMQRRIRASGFPIAEVKSELDIDTETVRMYISAGSQIRIGAMWLRGNRFTHDSTIWNEMKLQTGDLWNPEAINAAQRSLYRRAWFSRVSIEPLDGSLDSPTEEMNIDVVERDPLVLDLGASFRTQDGIQLSSQVLHRNIAGNGSSLLFGVNGFIRSGDRLFDAGRMRLAYMEPRIAATQTDARFELFLQSSTTLIDQYSFERFGGIIQLRFPEQDYGLFRLEYSPFTERLFDVEEDIIIGPSDEGRTFYSLLRLNYQLDTRDSPYLPRNGSFWSASTYLNSSLLGAENDFFSIQLSRSVFFPLNSRLIFANKIAGQYLRPLSDTEVIPLGHRIFLGGRQTLRGFSNAAVGPRGVLGNVLGGDSSLNVNTELQYHLSDEFVAVVFVDTGQAFLLERGTLSGDTPDLSDIRVSPGFGVHYNTPVGPVSAEWGFALDREFGERVGRFNIGVGSAF